MNNFNNRKQNICRWMGEGIFGIIYLKKKANLELHSEHKTYTNVALHTPSAVPMNEWLVLI